MKNSTTIKQSVINTFNRVGIDYQVFDNTEKTYQVYNRFGGGSCVTTALIAHLIDWVYSTNDQFDRGLRPCTIADFDRIRYFVLEQDSECYMTCLD